MIGVSRLAAEVPRQIANAHAIFNISNTLLLLPFTTTLARLVTRLVPSEAILPSSVPQFLDEAVLAVPALALNNARMETARLGDLVYQMMGRVPQAIKLSDSLILERISQQDDGIDQRQGEILKYLGKIRKLNLTDSASEEIQKLMVMVNALERIGDVISNDIVGICKRT